MGQPIQIKYRLTEEMLLQAMAEVNRQESRLFQRIRPIGFVVLPVVLLSSLISSKTFISLLPFGFMSLCFIFLPKYQEYLEKQTIQKMRVLDEEVCWTCSPDGVERFTPDSHVKEGWNVYIKAVRSENGFLLYPQEGIAYWLPFAGFKSKEDIEAVDGLIVANIADYRRV